MKKTWIKIKRGLLEPKHRDRLGIRIWLYVYILDKVDWETGMIFGWKDKDEAEDMGMQWRTLQKQRQELEELGYITCTRRRYSQDITVHNWTNPREYTGEEYNLKDESTQSRVLSEIDKIQSTPQSTPQIHSKPRTPSYRSHITYQGTWEDFKEHRKQIKKPMTPLAETRMLMKLSKYSVKVAIEMLDSSIENGWMGVFEINGKENKPSIESELKDKGYVQR